MFILYVAGFFLKLGLFETNL